MAISRMQLPRELYESGGITSLQDPRQGYFLGKLVKKITKPIKKIVKSPIGKAALAGAALYGLGGAKFLGGSGIFSGGQGMSRFGNLMNLFRPINKATGKKGILSSLFYNPEGEFSLGRAALTGLGTAGIVAPFFMGGDDDEEEEVVEQLDPNAIRQRAMQMYQQGYSPEESGLFFMPGREFVQRNFYAAGGGLASIDTPKRGMVDGPGSYAGLRLLDETNIKNRRSPGKFDFMRQTGPISESDKKFLENLSEEDLEELKKMKGPFIFELLEEILKTPYRIRGGEGPFPQDYAEGGLAEAPRMPMQEGGIMDLGGQEKDFRNTGGFVDLGREERADDVPARLSKNEFVFTAEAVRNAGGGDIDKGAEVMQNMMDNLEAGGMISEESQGMNPAQEMFEQAQMMESRIA